MRRLLALLAGLAACSVATAQHAGGAGMVLEHANNDVADTASLQRGAKYVVNYCLGCHSAQYVRYNRVAADLGLTEEQLIENLMFTGERPFDVMESAMRDEDAVRWFGVAPPDLSLIARSRGVDYIYNFLRGFYADEATATGANNLWLANTAMPHVLWQLQGVRALVETGEEPGAAPRLEQLEAGSMSAAEFDVAVRDIVNFLDYIGEPVQLQ
ncbi:MAG TPA: cytochrome c1, partial [Gammaproteobacteria bacterium]|nr:cytochrome c1 [Gammaproteobacteria bacterium]